MRNPPGSEDDNEDQVEFASSLVEPSSDCWRRTQGKLSPLPRYTIPGGCGAK